ncbi:ABC transporter permease [Curtobacterium flaccumfaciens]|uniref:ABC transporter permease n=1 Tax=Curtobacterium poinsettiae TaxID=159612 RepID=A0A9Q9PA35_9MICO|nr:MULTISPECIES: ABC transporter permease [Curtobacterium]MCS6561250.1 ABC transporter permease [Curtobacterium flaccumfaciens pv. poinsettiae]MDT0235019.1 ABC transporter permease [Curtobacterium sp. BRB10]UXN26760.1 ABC transporter permease [Curtobacterium flaccumfaciens]UXN29401.1 ABC transporter permease [Curtobacterium flaccumfaciens]UYC81603.1 ABC transporter permease [Curtobacterium flaccumfaciens pv. poinsettiae]
MTVTTTASLRPTDRRWQRVTAIRRRGRTVDLVAISALGVVVVVALLAPVIAPYSPVLRSGTAFLPPGSAGHLLGTDALGYDMLSRVLHGLRASLVAAFIVIASGVVFGTVVGLLAGSLGRWADNLLMRFTDLFLAMPGLVIALAVAAALGRGYWSALLGIAVVWWPMYARLVRGEIRAWAARPHLEAAVIGGIGWWRRTTRHLLPGVTSTIVVTASLDIGGLIVALSALSFLGLSSPAPAPELGAMAAQGAQYLLEYWWIPVVPGLAVAVVSFLANLAGDGVRDLVSR